MGLVCTDVIKGILFETDIRNKNLNLFSKVKKKTEKTKIASCSANSTDCSDYYI